jgi:hypothetical protein
MTYTAKTLNELRKNAGSLLKKMQSEFSSIDTELDSHATLISTHKSKFIVLSVGIGTNTAAATTGIDLADGTGATYYGVFFAPVAITALKMHTLLTEAYAKDTDDAKVEIYDNAETPVKIFGRTLTAAGEDLGSQVSTSPETGKSAIAAGTRLDLVVTATASSSGTGHAVVILEYEEA